MSTQHTPGPWGAHKSETGPWAISSAPGIWVATTNRRQWPAEDLANAHLMAAAPDMYEALKSMRAYLSKCPPHAEDRTGAEWGRMMDLSGAALNKAEGKS